MQVDWFIVVAQIINFLVLLWLLQRFLFRPLLKAIDLREADIRARVRRADQKFDAADAERLALADEREAFSAERDALLEAAQLEASQLRSRLIEEAQQAGKDARSQWVAGLQKDKAQFARDATEVAGKRLIDIASKALQDLAASSLEAAMANLFSLRLGELPKQELQAAKGAHKPVIICAQEPSADVQPLLLNATANAIGGGEVAKFQIDPALLAGFALTVGSHHYDLSLASYLEEFERRLIDSIETPRSPKAVPAQGHQAC